MAKEDIPRKAIYRLSLYQRCLQTLLENGLETVSSEALAKAAGVKSTQLRKDLAYFGQFGTRGLGYNVETLAQTIAEVLGKARLQPVILIGVGNLGSALLRYGGFQREGFEIVAGFDEDADVLRKRGLSVPVYAVAKMTDFIEENRIKMGIVAVPAPHGQSVANQLVGAGVQAILNFSPVVMQVPDTVTVHNVDLAAELESLSYFIR
ncbi:MAG: redox-sensing transcriptional repressor Rex [Verrucomicrobiota bacterium]